MPADAFVDARQFASFGELERFLRETTAADARRYMEAAQAFLSSPAYERFSVCRFALELVDALLQVGGA